MARKSSIMRQPVDIRDELNERMDGGATLDELVSWMRSIGITDVSRSALHRWAQQVDRIAAKAKRTRIVAEVLTRRLKHMPESRVLQANVEAMHGVLMQLIDAAENEDKVVINSKDALNLARSISALAQAEKAGAEKVIKVEEYKEETSPDGVGGVGTIEVVFVEPENQTREVESPSVTDEREQEENDA